MCCVCCVRKCVVIIVGVLVFVVEVVFDMFFSYDDTDDGNLFVY